MYSGFFWESDPTSDQDWDLSYMTKPFYFKQFTIHQDRCAMKVGTYGVLLGAWTSLEAQPDAILDIGAGTGLIALMLAQRSTAAIIDALELDENAYEQCVENFEASPWADRLFCYHAGLEEFTGEMEVQYDLIVSNPPFYSEEYSANDRPRRLARQNQFLPFEDLVTDVVRLLTPVGIFSTVIPFREEEFFLNLAAAKKLFPKRISRVRGNADTLVKRSMLEFQFRKSELVQNEFSIEVERHQYTPEYIGLTRDFYIKM
jgi:tRNA1Val (adenine37-N6)-methyltransferase